jgi:hypothetical protein
VPRLHSPARWSAYLCLEVELQEVSAWRGGLPAADRLYAAIFFFLSATKLGQNMSNLFLSILLVYARARPA